MIFINYLPLFLGNYKVVKQVLRMCLGHKYYVWSYKQRLGIPLRHAVGYGGGVGGGARAARAVAGGALRGARHRRVVRPHDPTYHTHVTTQLPSYPTTQLLYTRYVSKPPYALAGDHHGGSYRLTRLPYRLYIKLKTRKKSSRAVGR